MYMHVIYHSILHVGVIIV